MEKLKNGPHKLERCYKRVRGLLGGEWIFDTTEAFHVWEHPWYPYFYIPAISFNHSLQLQDLRNVAGAEHRLASEAKLSFGDRTASKVLIFNEGPLKDLVRIEPDDLGANYLFEVIKDSADSFKTNGSKKTSRSTAIPRILTRG